MGRPNRMEGIELSEAALHDYKDIAALQTESWRSAYRTILPGSYLDGPILEERETHWQKQRTLATMNGLERYTKKTRREVFLEEIEQVVPWRELCARIEPHYPKPGNGRPAVGVERMLRMYFLQQWFNLSDPGVEGPCMTR